MPVIKNIFRLVGPQSTLPTDSPLLTWATDEAGRQAVYQYGLIYSDLTKTLHVEEPFASCLNKSGYWLANIGFWASVLRQVWVAAVAEDEATFAVANVDLEPSNTAALLLLRGSCGILRGQHHSSACATCRANAPRIGNATARSHTAEAYCTAVEYLQRRGFGEVRVHEPGLPSFRKKHICFLPESCKKHLQHAGLLAMLFGVHVPAWRGIHGARAPATG